MKNLIKLIMLLFAIFCIEVIPIITLASVQQGIYAEYKMTSDKGNGLMKMYFFDGNSRTETNIEIPGMPGNGTMMIMITKKDSSDIIYIVNESSKTYTEMNSKAIKAEVVKDEIEITVLGKEKVNNYNCTHVKISDKSKNVEMEMWNSKEVIDNSFLKDINNQYLANSNYVKELETKSADGFLVRLLNGKMQMDLVKAEKRDIDLSMFSLEGYTKTEAPNLFDTNKMMQDIQKMTPEEREQYLDKLKEQYGK
jgi:hypothetical protein